MPLRQRQEWVFEGRDEGCSQRRGRGGGDSQAESLIFAPGVCAAAVALSLSEDWLTESKTKESEYELCVLTKASIVSNLYRILQVCEIEGNL